MLTPNERTDANQIGQISKDFRNTRNELRTLLQQTQPPATVTETEAIARLRQNLQEFQSIENEYRVLFVTQSVNNNPDTLNSWVLWQQALFALSTIDQTCRLSRAESKTWVETVTKVESALVELLPHTHALLMNDVAAIINKQEFAWNLLAGYAAAYTSLDPSKRPERCSALKREFGHEWIQEFLLALKEEAFSFSERHDDGIIPVNNDGLDSVRKLPAQATGNIEDSLGVSDRSTAEVPDINVPDAKNYYRDVENRDWLYDAIDKTQLSPKLQARLELYLREPGLLEYGGNREIAQRLGRSSRTEKQRLFDKLRMQLEQTAKPKDP